MVDLGQRHRSPIDLEISLKDRHGTGRRVTLECWISRTPLLHLVSTSTAKELAMALNEVRDDLIRQADDAKTPHRTPQQPRPAPPAPSRPRRRLRRVLTFGVNCPQ